MDRFEKFEDIYKIDYGGILVEHYKDSKGDSVFDKYQLARAFDISRNTIEQHMRRNPKELIENEHRFWAYKKGSPKAKFFTMPGLIKLGNFVTPDNASTILSSVSIPRQSRGILTNFLGAQKEKA